MINAHHVLTVTPDPEDFDPDLYEYEVDCPGVTDACRRYEECSEPGCPVVAAREHDTQDPTAHGRRHLHIDGRWLAATHGGMPDAVDGYFGPGRHPITWDVGDGTELVVFALDNAVPA